MADTVGSLNVKLGADPSGLQSGLASFQDMMTKTVSRIDPMIQSVNRLNTAFTGVNIGGFAEKFQKVFDPLTGMFSNAASGNLTGVLGDAVNLFSNLGQIGTDAMARLDRQARAAGRFGASQEEFSAIAEMARRAGIETDRLDYGLERIQIVLGQLRQEVGQGLPTSPMIDAFERLGISAQSAARMSVPQVFRSLRDAWRNDSNRSDRAFAFEEIFTRRGRDFLRVFNPEFGSFEENMSRSLGSGRGLTTESAQQIQDSARAQRELSREFEGMWDSFGKGIARGQAAWVSWLASMGRDGQVRRAASEVGEMFGRAVGESYGSPILFFRSALRDSASIRQRMQEADSYSRNLTVVEETNAELETANQISRQNQRTQIDMLNTMGMTAREAAIFRRERAGASQVELDIERSLDRQLTAAERISSVQKQAKDAAKAADVVGTFNQRMHDLNAMLRGGRGLTEEERAFGASSAFEQLARGFSVPNTQPRYAELAIEGTAEGMRAARAAVDAAQQKQETASERVVRVMEQVRDAQQKAAEVARETLQALRENGYIPAGGI